MLYKYNYLYHYYGNNTWFFTIQKFASKNEKNYVLFKLHTSERRELQNSIFWQILKTKNHLHVLFLFVFSSNRSLIGRKVGSHKDGVCTKCASTIFFFLNVHMIFLLMCVLRVLYIFIFCLH